MPSLSTPPPALDQNAIHVWYVELHASAAVESSFENILSVEELCRSRRFATATLRRRHTLSHAVLRILLHRYLGLNPKDVSFSYGPSGKPHLANPQARLTFNMSHSGDLAAYAFGMDRELGVDIELVRPMTDLTGVAKLAFSEKEFNRLHILNEDERADAFFRCWTRKEAFIKATGQGLSCDLKAFAVGLGSEKHSTVEFFQPYEPADIWHVYDLNQRGYSGAVVCCGPSNVMESKFAHSAQAFAHSAR